MKKPLEIFTSWREGNIIKVITSGYTEVINNQLVVTIGDIILDVEECYV